MAKTYIQGSNVTIFQLHSCFPEVNSAEQGFTHSLKIFVRSDQVNFDRIKSTCRVF